MVPESNHLPVILLYIHQKIRSLEKVMSLVLFTEKGIFAPLIYALDSLYFHDT